MDFLREVEKKLDLPPAEKEQVMRELESHYEELKSNLLASGMTDCEASEQAARRLGDPQDVASRLQAVHCRATWKSALLAALPFTGLVLMFTLSPRVGVPIMMIGVLLLLLFGAVMLAVSVVQMRRGVRPVWLTTWLAVGLMWPAPFAPYLLQVVRQLFHLKFYMVLFGIHIDLSFLLLLGLYGFEILLSGVIAVWVLWRSPAWERTAAAGIVIIGLAMLGCSAFAEGATFSSILIAIVAWAVLVTIIGLRVFVNHPYGGRTCGSLYLFSLYMFGFFAATSQFVHAIYSQPYAYPAFTILGGLMASLVIVAYTRLSVQRLKPIVILYGLLFAGLMGWGGMKVVPHTWLPGYDSLSGATVEGIRAAFLSGWIVLVPMLFERFRLERRPGFAR